MFECPQCGRKTTQPQARKMGQEVWCNNRYAHKQGRLVEMKEVAETRSK